MSGFDEKSQDQGSGRASAGEYAMGGLGGPLVLLLIAFLGYQAVAVRESGPELAVDITAVEQAGSGYEVHLRVHDDGGTTAETVQLGGQLGPDGRQVEQASETIAYVPPESRRERVLVFSDDPRDGELTVGHEGYKVP